MKIKKKCCDVKYLLNCCDVKIFFYSKLNICLLTIQRCLMGDILCNLCCDEVFLEAVFFHIIDWILLYFSQIVIVWSTTRQCLVYYHQCLHKIWFNHLLHSTWNYHRLIIKRSPWYSFELSIYIVYIYAHLLETWCSSSLFDFINILLLFLC